MMKNYLIAIIYLSLLGISDACLAQQKVTIGFGSCAYQDRPQAIWSNISKQSPDLFVMLGDNVYIDSTDPTVMENTYQQLADNPYFDRFRQSHPVIGIWDDHDYGVNDGGKEFSAKEEAKKAFIRFFDYPEVRELKTRKGGIYHSKWIEQDGLKVHVVLLDTRWYRDPLTRTYLSREQSRQLLLGPYQPNFDNGRTILGEQQWKWFKKQLSLPADVKIIASSIQVIPEYSGWELWANFPAEREKMLTLAATKSAATKTLFITGDVHRAEVSELMVDDKRLVELTSSGLDAKVYPAAPNKHRVGDALIDLNYGLLTIIKDGQDITVAGQILDDDNQVRLAIEI